jgi:hypothetical protein
MRALIIEKFISTRFYPAGPEKVTPIFPSLTQQTAPETWPRPTEFQSYCLADVRDQGEDEHSSRG